MRASQPSQLLFIKTLVFPTSFTTMLS
ncbi:hypothetical protein CCHR01_05091 [Colletotrichum chrysophilum]|uniref:Uncharacterized protein n=1 Tax=Colletotrichum chrysophilum TaxID=1836956 RepID=A0AAD9ASE5_9PEZI|nr:hypothetical protein CCHR01_05091 [Colletotrichum chrysophilum]